jgi:hypothetical protein
MIRNDQQGDNQQRPEIKRTTSSARSEVITTKRVGGAITDVVVGGDAGVERWLICCMFRLIMDRSCLPVTLACLAMHENVV